jgi:hypothetical protein
VGPRLWGRPRRLRSEHAAELCFSHPARGKYRLALFYPDAETAYQELPKALGKKIAVNGVWSDMQQRLVEKL